jgi:PHD/YefM family antitoxin component YafN of YafNO toxin-antitoxin module
MELHPQILEKDGKKEFVVLPYEEYERLAEALADYDDLRELREAKNGEYDAETRSLKDVRREMRI